MKSSRMAGFSNSFLVNGVSTRPGAMPTTRIPRLPSSNAPQRVIMSTPAFAAQYATCPSPGCCALTDEILMMTPGSSLLEHLPGAVLHAVEDSAERHRLNGLPLVSGQLSKRRNGTKAGAIHHDIQ